MKISASFFFILPLCILTSCIVKAPRYSTVEKVMTLKLNQTQEEITQKLGTVPYNLVSLTDSEKVILYKYRATERAVVPFLMTENNGKEVKGKYANLQVTFGRNGLSKKYESCYDCDVTMLERKQIDINKILTFLTITLPIALVFLGISISLK